MLLFAIYNIFALIKVLRNDTKISPYNGNKKAAVIFHSIAVIIWAGIAFSTYK
jgi:hypothetical protein